MKWNGVFKAASASFWPLGGCKTRLQIQPTVTNSCLSHIHLKQSRIIPSGRVCVHVKKVRTSVLSLVSNDSWEKYLSLSPLDVLTCCFICQQKRLMRSQNLKMNEKCIKMKLKLHELEATKRFVHTINLKSRLLQIYCKISSQIPKQWRWVDFYLWTWRPCYSEKHSKTLYKQLLLAHICRQYRQQGVTFTGTESKNKKKGLGLV